jgi:hypothetical protein
MNRLLNRKTAVLRNSRLMVPALTAWLFLALAVSTAQTPHTIKIELYPEGQRTNPAVLYVTGDRYQDNPLIHMPQDSSMSNSSPEMQFLGQVIFTNANGSLDDVLRMWDPRDRDAIRKVASDTSIFEGNRNFYRGITSSRLMARISYGTYDIFFVQHISQNRTVVKDYPVTHVNGALMNTNALQSDPVFVYLSTRYAQVLQQGLQ